MVQVYSDDNGARVILRHRGPAGKGLPPGGTAGQIFAKASEADYDGEWVNPPDGVNGVTGPASAVDGNLALFDGVTGKVIKDSGKLLSEMATVALVNTKQNAEAGKGLSQENFTTTLKNKLDALVEHYRGTYASTALVESEVVDPVAGDFALVEVLGEAQTVSFWDATNDQWDHKIVEPMTGQEIADAVFLAEDAAAWDQETCRIFTDAEKTQLAQHESLVNGALSGILAGQTAYTEKTASYIITTNDRTINCTNNSFTLTLPTALGNAGRLFVIKNSGTGTITIATSDGIQLIDDATTYELSSQWDSVTIQSTGSGWIII